MEKPRHHSNGGSYLFCFVPEFPKVAVLIHCTPLIKDPEAGDLILGSGWYPQVTLGCGWSRQAVGIRVVYYARVRRGQIWMLTLYAKNVVKNIPANVLRQIREEIDG